jgi:NTE family protein
MGIFNKKKKIGLALGGGAVLGAAHIGVLKAIEEQKISINCIAGTSAGALVAALFAFGKSSDEIEKIAMDLDWFEISELSLSKYGLLSNKRLGKIITDNIGDVKFGDAGIPLAMVATDIATGKKVVLKKGKVEEAVMASTCIPGIFSPVEINKKMLVDGGIVDNVPVSVLKELGAGYLIGVDLYAEHTQQKPGNIIEIILNTYNFVLMNATKLQTGDADLLIKPDLSKFNMVDPEQVPDLIKKGYAEAKKALKKL